MDQLVGEGGVETALKALNKKKSFEFEKLLGTCCCLSVQFHSFIDQFANNFVQEQFENSGQVRVCVFKCVGMLVLSRRIIKTSTDENLNLRWIEFGISTVKLG